jgi:anhydro-N-acetylmuramic acid kinase
MNNKTYFIGLMSGTSLDAIDVAVVDIQRIGSSNDNKISLIASHSVPLPNAIKSQLIHLSFEPDININVLGETSIELAQLFAKAINDLLKSQNIDSKQVVAIGSHGLTIRHQPNSPLPFSMQITDSNLLAQLTAIDVISDFRNMDIAAGGQGAPLVPAFHQAIFSEVEGGCIILNLGGIANITVLNPKEKVLGYDTGPANTLLDAWCQKHTGNTYDKNGQWAASGKVIPELLEIMLEEPYLSMPFPKSTGKELFNLSWLEQKLSLHAEKIDIGLTEFSIAPQDIQATLLQLTVLSTASQIKLFSHTKTLFICGGGVHNQFLIRQLERQLPQHKIKSTETFGINSDALEAMAFAWLAYCRINLISANSPSVTGAQSQIIMGCWYSAQRHKVS